MSDYFGPEPSSYQTPLLVQNNFSDITNPTQALLNLGAASSDSVLKAANPIGTIIAYYGSVAPYGYLPCSGQTVSNTTFPSLVTFLGGTTSATLPDMRGEFLRGWDNGRGVDASRVVKAWQADAFQGHYHSPISNMSTGGSTAFNQITNSAVSTGLSLGASPLVNTQTGGPIADAGSGTPRTASETRPRNIAVLYCIKAYDTPVSPSLISMTSLVTELAGRGTPNVFDNSLSMATTAFVQRALGNMAGYTGYATSTTLTSADLGKYILATGSSMTLTLPDSTLIPAGSRIYIQASGSTSVTVTSINGALSGPNGGSGPSTELLTAGVSSEFISNGTNWISTGGSGLISAIANGYSKSSNGTIIQWGTITLLTTTTSAVITLPFAFPNNHLRGVSSDTGNTCYPSGYGTTSLSTATIYVAPYPTSVSAGTIAAKNGTSVISWIAIGN